MGFDEPCFRDDDEALARQAFTDAVDAPALERDGWVKLPLPELPFAFARNFGVILTERQGAPVLLCRQGVTPQTLLEVRRVVGLRNSAHSLVKLMNPCDGPCLVVGNYTHPEYLQSMSATFALTGQHALLLRGTEGEPVADARRTPAMDVFKNGTTLRVQEQREGSMEITATRRLSS